VQITGTIQGSELANQVDVGGLLGRNDASPYVATDETDDPNQYALITNCTVNGELNGSAQTLNMGGLVGYGRDVIIQTSTNAANIFCTPLGSYINCHMAGIVGYGRAFELDTVANSGTISSIKFGESGGDTNFSIAGSM